MIKNDGKSNSLLFLAGIPVIIKSQDYCCMIKKVSRIIPIAILFIAFTHTAIAQTPSCTASNFNKENILAWCIVPFDSKKRGPEERAAMLNGLGITKLAYDWRREHIPSFDAEADALKKHKIKLQSFWLLSDTNAARSTDVEAVFSFLKKRKIKTEIWYFFLEGEYFKQLSQEEKVAVASRTVQYIARRADSIGCKVGLYNHEGWFGEPENQVAIIEKLKMKNIGIIYNFNHAQFQVERFPEFFPKLIPYLLAVNLAGLKSGDKKIYPIGVGDSEEKMIQIVCTSGFKGPIGIINEDTDPDAEKGLQINMDGLKKILSSIGNAKAAATYR